MGVPSAPWHRGWSPTPPGRTTAPWRSPAQGQETPLSPKPAADTVAALLGSAGRETRSPQLPTTIPRAVRQNNGRLGNARSIHPPPPQAAEQSMTNGPVARVPAAAAASSSMALPSVPAPWHGHPRAHRGINRGLFLTAPWAGTKRGPRDALPPLSSAFGPRSPATQVAQRSLHLLGKPGEVFGGVRCCQPDPR